PSGVSVLLAGLALVGGIVIGRYTANSVARAKGSITSSIPSPSPIYLPSLSIRPSPPPDDRKKEASPANTEDVVAAIKNALGHLGSRRSYVEFGKLSELINQNNVGEVLAFAESLPKAQDKNMVLSMLLGRWAEFDPRAALGYAQTL